MPDARALNRHAALVNHMAEVMGVDMTAALAEARLTREGWATAVMSCLGCARPEACDRWLAERGGPGAARVARAPDYCQNAALLAGLARNEGERENGRDDA